MSQKITEEQLKELNEKYGSVNQLKIYIGDVEGQKHMLLHQLVGAQEELQKVLKSLEEEYGKGSIDLKDGTITLEVEK
jgi:hypothetical protein